MSRTIIRIITITTTITITITIIITTTTTTVISPTSSLTCTCNRRCNKGHYKDYIYTLTVHCISEVVSRVFTSLY